jgi:uncharacterized membrane protein YedE/YeeE
MLRYTPYLFAGLLFGWTLIKSEASSWYRIQEMFHLQAFHMYGIMATAVLSGLVGVQLIKFIEGRKSLVEGTPISIPEKDPGWKQYLLGGAIFGLGWGVIGLCPGPIFALVGAWVGGAFIVLLGALHGTWLYGVFKEKLPH